MECARIIIYNDTFYSVDKEGDSVKVSWYVHLPNSEIVFKEEEYSDEMELVENFRIYDNPLLDMINDAEPICEL